MRNNSKILNSKVLVVVLIVLVFILISLFLSIRISQNKLALHLKGAASTPTPTIFREKAYVNYVFDGDTIELSGKITLRLVGIDAPETANKYTHFKEECFASDSAKIAKELLMGQNIEIEKDLEDKDNYGRLLRYVFLDDVFINEFLLRNGYAKLEEKTINTRYKNILTEAENEAKRDGRGLWGKCGTN